MKIKKGDSVKVISGKDRGKVSTVKIVLRKIDKIVVEGVAMVKRHQKKTGENKPGGIISKESPIHISNVMLIDPKSNKPARIGFKTEGNKKVRITKKYNTILK
jgi:large subunit ribosomal protein L24